MHTDSDWARAAHARNRVWQGLARRRQRKGMPVEGFRERHDTCRFGSYRADEDAEGLVVAGCEHPQVGSRYDERFCARECPAYHARAGRQAHGRIPSTERQEPANARR